MMTPQELKNSILQLAIQGRLVEQRPEEGTGAELLREISTQRRRDAEAAKKESRAKSAKSAKESRLASNVSRPVEDAPFEIPESWVWVRLGEVAAIERGSSIKRSETSPTGFPCIRYGEIYTTYGFSFTETKSFVPESLAHTCHKANYGDVLCTLTGEWKEEIAKATAYLGSKPIAIGGDLARITTQAFEPTLLVFFFFSPFLIQQKALKANGDMIVHIGKEAVCNLLIPLPPLAEQKRIVAKIEELLPYVERYEKAWGRLEEFNRRFPEDMRKSVLQMAIQGKLVEQRPEEGTGAELLREILAAKGGTRSRASALMTGGTGATSGTGARPSRPARRNARPAGPASPASPTPVSPEEQPFEIPESWVWVRLGDIIDVRDGTHDTPKYVSEGVPLVTSRNLINGTIDFDTAKLISYADSEAINIRSGVDDGDIVFAMIGTIGNPVLIKKERNFSIKNMALFKPISRELFCMEYLLQFLTKAQTDMRKSASASVQSFVSLSFLRNYPIPLPPLAEQKRIVAKLEEILPLCERLK